MTDSMVVTVSPSPEAVSLMTSLAPIRPGMFAVVDTGTSVTAPIRIGEYLLSLTEHAPGDKPELPEWDHAVMCTRVTSSPDGKPVVWIAEAEGSGAVERPWHYEDRPHKWSAGIIDVPEAAGECALRYTRPGPWGGHGVPYSYLDYEAIAAHSLHLPMPGLKDYIADTRHMICSQLVDQAALDAGCHLFTDDRWPGYVTPYHLGLLLGA